MTAVQVDAGPPRPLPEVCAAACQAPCLYCSRMPGHPCAVSTVTGAPGYHVARFARAMRAGLISGRELVNTLAVPKRFSGATLIYEDGWS